MARHPSLLLAALPLALLAGCGDDADPDPGGASGGEGVVTVVAEDIGFGADAYEAGAGDVPFEYVNEGVIEHTLVIEGVDDFELLVEARGDVDRGSVELEPGTYRLFCDLPGHRQAGMEAELVVR